MNPLLILFVLLLTNLPPLRANGDTELPVQGFAQSPVLLLDLGEKPRAVPNTSTQISMGEVSRHDSVASIGIDSDAVTTLHPGFGHWSIDFRFQLKQRQSAKFYQFWARWRQGGEPDVCVQTFEVWAGADPSTLEWRATLNLKPKGWDYAWASSDTWVSLQPSDTVIEVRESGAGHDAKVFDAFMLAPPQATLPVNGNADKPMVLLELGQAPQFGELEKNPTLHVQLGNARAGYATESLRIEKDEVQVLHQGFGRWDVDFDFELNPSIRPGKYRFFARYKSGGEVSQVMQRFVIKAGSEKDKQATRGELATLNDTPWTYQWLAATGTVTLLPGDRWLSISNTGQADGAKVFDAFLLQWEAPATDWMNAEQARLRNRFLALTKPVSDAKRYLYVLDGKGAKDRVLYAGLANAEAQAQYENISASYLAGEEAEVMARRLNVSNLPAAVISDDHYTLLGVLTEPVNEDDVLAFLNDPARSGWMPAPPTVAEDESKPLRSGIPEAWLVGGLQDGLSGVSIYGLDTESVLRPNPGRSYLSVQMMGGKMLRWQPTQTGVDSSVTVLESTQHSYGWSRGTGYAQLYLHSDKAAPVWLHLKQSGISTSGWLDGQPFSFVDDPLPPTGFSTLGGQIQTWIKGFTPEGLAINALTDTLEAPQLAKLELTPGWHSLLVKLVMQHDRDQRFFFKAVFTDANGHAIDSMQTRLSDPSANLSLNSVASQLRPLIFVDAPANLPHPGDKIKLNVDMRWHKTLEQTGLQAPLHRFQAKLKLRLVDYEGKEVAIREVNGLFPGETDIEFDSLDEAGYYAVYPSLYTSDGRLIMNYPADGFSVIRGFAEQKQRLDKKKLWNNDYYALADGDNSFVQVGGYFSWLQRMGIFKSYGSYPGFDAKYRTKWKQAKELGLELFADSSGDSAWLNDKREDGENFIRSASDFTRFFKSTNEIDIRHESAWQKLREPEHWVERAKWEYEQVHKIRQDAHYVGGSLVRPAEDDWFKQVLQLGLDHYQDAWDVHAYPQHSPRFGEPLGNGVGEDERGVLAVYANLGKKNRLPFWLGEVGAKAMHGSTGRRWQAEQVAKMIAWVNSRSDYLGMAFCIAHEYDQAYGRIWDYSMGHKPGEAAMYTAGALVDGLPYQAVETNDAAVQAGMFGSTIMIWRDDAAVTEWLFQLDPAKSWIVVDVVGRSRPLAVDASGHASVHISASPVYIIPSEEFQRLTR